MLNNNVILNNENKIIWKSYPIAKLKKGNDYLNPEVDIICDDALNEETKSKLNSFLIKWLNNYIIDNNEEKLENYMEKLENIIENINNNNRNRIYDSVSNTGCFCFTLFCKKTNCHRYHRKYTRG